MKQRGAYTCVLVSSGGWRRLMTVYEETDTEWVVREARPFDWSGAPEVPVERLRKSGWGRE